MINGPSVIIGVVGLLFVACGIYVIYDDYRFKIGTRKTKGIVVRNVYKMHVENTHLFFPVVEFYDELTNQKYTFEADSGSHPAAYSVGEQLEVRYHPERPQEARIDTALKWGLPCVFIFLGSIGVVIEAFELLSTLR